MEASKCDELPAISQLCQSRDELFNLRVRESRSLPVKRRRKVIRKHQIGIFSEDSLSKFSSNVQVWGWSFHPQHVGKFSKLQSSFYTVLDVTLDFVEPLFRSTGFPVEFQIKAQFSGKKSCFWKGKICAVFGPSSYTFVLLFSFWECIDDFSNSCLWKCEEEVRVRLVNLT